MLGEQPVAGIFPVTDIRHNDDAASQIEGGFHRIGQTGEIHAFLAIFPAMPDNQTVDDGFDGVGFVAIQFDIFGDIVDFAVHPHPHIPGLLDILEHRLVLALAVLD